LYFCTNLVGRDDEEPHPTDDAMKNHAGRKALE